MTVSARKIAQRTVQTEYAGLQKLERALDENFDMAVDMLAAAKGRVIVSGMGKSGHIGHKIAATLASTGTPSSFVHPAEASHGDLGMITPSDVILALSWSGETPELANLLSYAKRFSIGLIALTSNAASALGRHATICLRLPKADEACPNGLAPTTSTTMQLVMGDALAVALLERRNFGPADFKNFHPGGKLGAGLVTLAEIMHSGDMMPLAAADTVMREALLIMTAKGFGTLGAVDKKGKLIGIITDGDLRRNMGDDLLARQVGDIMTHAPRTITSDSLAAEALAIMNEAKIQCLFICADGKPIGLVRILDLLRIGVS